MLNMKEKALEQMELSYTVGRNKKVLNDWKDSLIFFEVKHAITIWASILPPRCTPKLNENLCSHRKNLGRCL